MLLQEQTGAAVAYWLGRRIQDRNEDFERSNHISLLSGYPEPAATQIRTRGLRPARDGYKLQEGGKKRRTSTGAAWLTFLSFYKNHAYKNVEAQISEIRTR